MSRRSARFSYLPLAVVLLLLLAGFVRPASASAHDIQATYSYSPFGSIVDSGGDGSASTPLLWAGQLSDQVGGSNFIYMRSRWYDPTTAQFVTRDPDVAQTMTPYAYAADDPLDITDPTGLHGKGNRQQQEDAFLAKHHCAYAGSMSLYWQCVDAQADGWAALEATFAQGASDLGSGLESVLFGGSSSGAALRFLEDNPQVAQTAAMVAITVADPEEGISLEVGEDIGTALAPEIDQAVGDEVGDAAADDVASAGEEAAGSAVSDEAGSDAAEAPAGDGAAATERAGNGGVRLYRGAGDAEVSDIEATGVYRIAGNSARSGKYFYPTREQAEAFVSKGWASRVTSGVFPRSVLDDAVHISPAGEGSAYFVPSSYFPLGPVEFP